MSIASDVTRIESAKAAIKAAIEDKGVIVPDATLLDDMAALIESIETGGSIRVEQGTVTLAENVGLYTFVDDIPDIFIAYIEDDSEKTYSQCNYVWAIVQDKRLWMFHGTESKTQFIFGRNNGVAKYYTPLKCAPSMIGQFSSNSFNGKLGATTYKWYAIYGVTAT